MQSNAGPKGERLQLVFRFPYCRRQNKIHILFLPSLPNLLQKYAFVLIFRSAVYPPVSLAGEDSRMSLAGGRHSFGGFIRLR
jgi:hypothetical protein